MNMDGRERPMNRQSGLSFIEFLISMLVFAIALEGLSYVNVRLRQSLASARAEILALNLARDIREEIRSVRALDPDAGGTFGPEEDEAGQPRVMFDDVDDYDGLDEFPPRTVMGRVLEGHEQYRRTVRVRPVGFSEENALAADHAGATDFRLVTIAVYDMSDRSGDPTRPMVESEFLVSSVN